MLGVAWGLTWPAMRIALYEVHPFGLRWVAEALGASTLFVLAGFGRRLVIPKGIMRFHIVIAGLFNVSGFTILASFAQIGTATSRVVILAYTMPIWASVLAVPILDERLNTARVAGLALCATGVAVLTYPLASTTIPVSILLALAAAMCWAIGTVYLKWVRMEADPLAVAAWQLVVGFVSASLLLPFFEDIPAVWHLRPETLLSLVFTGVIGAGFAYFVWFTIVGRVSAITAALGALSVPVIGIASSMAILGERPSVPDVVGSVLVIAAAACALLQPNDRVGIQTAEPKV